MHVEYRLLIILVACVLVNSKSQPICAAVDEAIPLDKALSVIRANEAAIRTLEYNVVLESGTARDANEPLVIVEESPTGTEGHVRIRPHSGEFFFKSHSITKSGNGDGSYVLKGRRRALASNGERFEQWERVSDAAEIPAADDVSQFAQGIIAPAEDTEAYLQNQGFLSLYAATAGVAYMPPFFWTGMEPPMKLSKLLERQAARGFDVTVRDAGNGFWEITVPIMFPEGDVPFFIRMQYDTTSGATTEAVWSTGDPPEPWKRMTTKLKDIHGFRLPVTVKQILMPPNAPTLGVIRYSDIKVNQQFGAEDFSVDFPPGVRVTDHIERKFYVTGKEPEDEQAAIAAFIQRTGLPGPAGSSPLEAGGQAERAEVSWRLIVLVGINLVLLICVIGYFVRTRWAGGILLCAAAGIAGSAETAVAVEHREVTGQCGFRVAVFTFEAFGIQCNPDRLATGFHPTAEGISLAALRDALQARGLVVAARQGVTAVALAEAIHQGRFAIIPLPVPGGYHYFAALLNTAGMPVLVNVPESVMPLRPEQIESDMKISKGLVLFVSRPESDSLAKAIKINPGEIDLGAFSTKRAKPLTAELTLRNTAPHAIAVSEVVTSCGCTRPEWTGGLVAAGAEQTLRFEVSPSAWGSGQHRKGIAIRFPDGSERRLAIIGNGITAEDEQGLTLSTQKITIDITDVMDTGHILHPPQRVRVRCAADRMDEISAHSDRQWLSLNIIPINDRFADLQFKIDMRRELEERFAAGQREIEAGVTLSLTSEYPPVKLAVIIYRGSLVATSPPVTTIPVGGVAEFRIDPLDADDAPIRMSGLIDSPPGTKVKVASSDSGMIVKVRARAGGDQSPSSIRVIKCPIITARDRRDTASLILRILEKQE